ncbi:hypothetical protein D3C71_1716160 [compost metagenome]
MIENDTAYVAYRVNISANNGGSELNIDELGLYESAELGYSAIDAGFGLWPVNNEWERYVLNFPENKIQDGKTIEDVFHCSRSEQTGVGTYSWTQDTPSVALAIATNKIVRAGNYFDAAGVLTNTPVSYIVSSLTRTYVGFRPVFEYKEV